MRLDESFFLRPAIFGVEFGRLTAKVHFSSGRVGGGGPQLQLTCAYVSTYHMQTHDCGVSC